MTPGFKPFTDIILWDRDKAKPGRSLIDPADNEMEIEIDWVSSKG